MQRSTPPPENQSTTDAGRPADQPTGQGATPNDKPTRQRRRIATAAAANGQPPPAAPPADNSRLLLADGQPYNGQIESAQPTATPPPIELDAAAKAPNPFSAASLRINDYSSALSLQKVITAVPYRKPPQDLFIRVHPSDEYTIKTLVISPESDQDRSQHLINPALWQALATEPLVRPVFYAWAITQNQDTFLWFLNVPKDGRSNNWWTTGLALMARARTEWLRVFPSNGCYSCIPASKPVSDVVPRWPDLTMDQVLDLAFKTKLNTLGDELLKKLRGEAL
jgi:hypothetical protein